MNIAVPRGRWRRLTDACHCSGRAGLTLAFLCALMLLTTAAGAPARVLLRYDRGALAAGQWWRLLTAHFIHLNPAHALMDLAGLCLLWALFVRDFSPRQWLVIVASAIAAIDAGLWLLASTVDWYVGSSGWLHGVMAAGIVARIRDRRPEGWVLAVAVAGKLAWEQWHGPLGLMPGGVVITQAHLYGAAGGLAAALLLVVQAAGRKPL